MGDETIERLFRNNTVWIATGNEKFWRAFERLAGETVRFARLPAGTSEYGADALVARTRAAHDTRPIILFGKPSRHRFRALYDFTNAQWADGRIVADFADFATVTTGNMRDWRLLIFDGQLVCETA